jgi:hypothetical protein
MCAASEDGRDKERFSSTDYGRITDLPAPRFHPSEINFRILALKTV